MKYKDIVKILNIDEKKDRLSAKFLSEISVQIKEKIDLKDVYKKIKGKNIIIFGAGPSLMYDLNQLMNLKNFNTFVKVSVDGATKALIEKKIFPDFVVTDLDGDINAIKKANENNAILVVHAHGDNIGLIKKYIKNFKNLIFTHQTDLKLKNLHNFGGFTDGDRALLFVLKFKPKIVILAGMDFGRKIGEYSKKIFGKRKKFKLKKLEIGKRIIEEMKNKKVYDFTKNGNLKIKKISIEEMKNIE